MSSDKSRILYRFNKIFVNFLCIYYSSTYNISSFYFMFFLDFLTLFSVVFQELIDISSSFLFFPR